MNPRIYIFVLILFLMASLQVEAAYSAGGEAAGDVIYEDTNIIFGKGIEPPGTAAFENLTKVKASYVEVSSGVFQLVTMFSIK